LLYALDDSVWGMKITPLEESADFATLDTEKLFSKLKSHELSRKGRPNHAASLTSKTFVTSTRVGGHGANSTNTTDSSALEFALSFLCVASDEHYESIPDDEIALLTRKFRALHRFCKERRSSRGCFECGDTTHFIIDCPKRKKLDSFSTSTSTPSETATVRVTTRRSTASRIRRISSRRWCPERVLPSVTSTSPVTTPLALRRMRGPSARQATSPAFASWASHRDTSSTLTLM
jgi:hypothetical protein